MCGFSIRHSNRVTLILPTGKMDLKSCLLRCVPPPPFFFFTKRFISQTFFFKEKDSSNEFPQWVLFGSNIDSIVVLLMLFFFSSCRVAVTGWSTSFVQAGCPENEENAAAGESQLQQLERFPSADFPQIAAKKGHSSRGKCVPCKIKGLGNHFMACEIYGFGTNACSSLGLRLLRRPKQTAFNASVQKEGSDPPLGGFCERWEHWKEPRVSCSTSKPPLHVA